MNGGYPHPALPRRGGGFLILLYSHWVRDPVSLSPVSGERLGRG